MPRFRDVEFRKKTRIFDDFFKVDELLIAHENNNGSLSSDQRRLVFDRGDSVGAFLFNTDELSQKDTNLEKPNHLRSISNDAHENGRLIDALQQMMCLYAPMPAPKKQ